MAFLWAVPAAQAQLSPGGAGNQPQPRPLTPDLAPPALPGIGDAPIARTAPVLPKGITGDPTAALFTAVNNGDYGAAQDALSRGADITAQNALGETPLALSIALNHNNITFMLLSVRNEGGGDEAATPPVVPASTKVSRNVKPKPALVIAAKQPAPQLSNDPGTPNPDAGFLGFGAANQ